MFGLSRGSSFKPPKRKHRGSKDEEVLEGQPKSLLMQMLKQVKPGLELSKIPFPAFVLEPRSLLDKVTDFFKFPDLIFETIQQKTPEQRMLYLMKWFMSGWHLRPKGVKKPYNPVLGEVFSGQWDVNDMPNLADLHIGESGSDGSDASKKIFYVAEQVSHHPPISAFMFAGPGVSVEGHVYPHSTFQVNTIKGKMDGMFRIYLHEHDEMYVVTLPNFYVRGVLMGTIQQEIGGECTLTCKKTGLEGEIDFRTKSMFGSDEHNEIRGKMYKINDPKSPMYHIYGFWDDIMYMHNVEKNEESVFFDCHGGHKPAAIKTRPVDEQEYYESQKLWQDVTAAIVTGDMDKATDAKTVLEDRQRRGVKHRKEEGKEWAPRFFEPVKHGDNMKNWEWRYKYSDSLMNNGDTKIAPGSWYPPPAHADSMFDPGDSKELEKTPGSS